MTGLNRFQADIGRSHTREELLSCVLRPRFYGVAKFVRVGFGQIGQDLLVQAPMPPAHRKGSIQPRSGFGGTPLDVTPYLFQPLGCHSSAQNNHRVWRVLVDRLYHV